MSDTLKIKNDNIKIEQIIPAVGWYAGFKGEGPMVKLVCWALADNCIEGMYSGKDGVVFCYEDSDFIGYVFQK